MKLIRNAMIIVMFACGGCATNQPWDIRDTKVSWGADYSKTFEIPMLINKQTGETWVYMPHPQKGPLWAPMPVVSATIWASTNMSSAATNETKVPEQFHAVDGTTRTR